ncbi:MAG: methyl-accepting chemotaxis protein [Geminicoccaceae bacterium]
MLSFPIAFPDRGTRRSGSLEGAEEATDADASLCAADEDEPLQEFGTTRELMLALPEREQKMLTSLTDNIEAEMSRSVKSVILRADEMSQSAFAMLMRFSDMRERSNDLVESSKDGRASIETLSRETDNLIESMSRINSETADTRGALENAMEVLSRVTRERDRLLASATEISSIVELIARIAHQTNLLAINATIEAARAGEAGKGFIVVAGEVKNLARQTAEASKEVSNKIKAVRGSTESITEVLLELEGTVGSVQDRTLGVTDVVMGQRGVVERIGGETRNISNLISAVVDNATQACDALSVSEEGAAAIQKDCLTMTDSVHELRVNLTRILRGSVAGNRRSHPRVEVLMPAEILYNGERYATEVVDLSIHGASFRMKSGGGTSLALQTDDRLTLYLPLDRTVDATVRRATFDNAGVEFDEHMRDIDDLIAFGMAYAQERERDRKHADDAGEEVEEDLLWD